MNSSSSRKETEEHRQAAIRKQIALLQAQLSDFEGPQPLLPESPKRKLSPSRIIAPSTPSPKKRKLSHPTHDKPKNERRPQRPPSPLKTQATRSRNVQPSTPASSTVIRKLAVAHAQKDHQLVKTTITRSSAFSDKAVQMSVQDDGMLAPGAQARDDRLALVEELVPGPVDHKAPFDDPHFEKLEPDSGIRLSSRVIPYDEFQEYLRGRYYLSPSKLYSVVRLLPNKQGYDVPVSGDWLTIAVVAERGQIKHSQAPVGIGREDKMHQDEDENDDNIEQLSLDGTKKPVQANPRKGKQPHKVEPSKPGGKKYVNMKLVDFGCRMHSSSTTGGQSIIRGDAALSLLLFEADTYDLVTKENGKKEKIYKGGSRGAFEKMSKLREGAVVAFLNPRILKPFQRSADAPHPTDNILAITPESVSSIAVIGYSQDLGMCKAVKRDGTACGSWCDRRVSDVCDWHIQHAVERKRAGRAEFATGTSGMSTGAKRKKPAYDPSRQWGLKPTDHEGGGGATYVVSGHIISSNNDSKSLFIAESMGRDAQAKASRKVSAQDADRALQQLLKKDKEGSKALVSARKYGKIMAKQEGKEKNGQSKKKGKGSANAAVEDQQDEETDEEAESDEDSPKKKGKNAYSATLIKQLGFDPTAKDGKRSADAKVQSKLDALAALQAARKDIDLRPRPGKKRSCVRRPSGRAQELPAPMQIGKGDSTRDKSFLDLANSDEDELEKQEHAVFGKAINLPVNNQLVDLDSSDVELEVEPPT